MVMQIDITKVKNKKQFIGAQNKRNKIMTHLTAEPKTAIQLAAETGMSEPTMRHHLNKMERYKQLVSLVKYNVFGDMTKRYFALGTDISLYDDDYARNSPSQIYYRKIAESMMNQPKTKQDVADDFNITIKRCHDIFTRLQKQNMVNIVMIKNLPWRAASKYYYHPDSDDAEIAKQVEEIENRYKGMLKSDYDKMFKDGQRPEPKIELPDLPPNLLAMMGYTSAKPPEGKQYNVDEYSAGHPDWNKFQGRKGIAYSNIGCSMQMMIESAPGAI